MTMNPPSETHYGVSYWAVFDIPGLDDPVEMAEIARSAALGEHPGQWVVVAGEVEYIVDLENEAIISEKLRDYIRDGPDGSTEVKTTITGPDGSPMDVWIRIGRV